MRDRTSERKVKTKEEEERKRKDRLGIVGVKSQTKPQRNGRRGK